MQTFVAKRPNARAELSPVVIDHKPLTVLQLSDAKTLGEPERATLEVARAVVAAGGRALIAAGGPMGPRMRVAEAETLDWWPEGFWLHRTRFAAALAAGVAGAGVDIVHARSAETAAIGRKIAGMLGAHFITTLHEAPASGWFRGAGARALLKGQPVIAVSPGLAETVGTATTVIPRGVDMDVFTQEAVSVPRTVQTMADWGLEEDTRQILLVPDRLAPGAGCGILLRAAAALAAQRTERDFLMLLAGGGAQADKAYVAGLEARIVKSGLAGIVRIAPPAEDGPAGLKLASAVVSATARPPADGRRIIEALAMGRPLIAPDRDAIREIAADGETGWLTPPGDVEALTAAMDAALSMGHGRRAHIALAGRARIRSRYTLNGMLTAILDVYETAAGRPFRPSVA